LNLKLTAKLLMASVTLALLLYGLSSAINPLLGVEQSILNEAWQLVALAIAFSLVAGYAYPKLRGIRKGDSLVAFTRRARQVGARKIVTNGVTFVRAQQDGKQGEKINVKFANGLSGEGVIESYGGFLIPARIRITHAEKPEGDVRFD
jgi:hypothetical protein